VCRGDAAILCLQWQVGHLGFGNLKKMAKDRHLRDGCVALVLSGGLFLSFSSASAFKTSNTSSI
jgi:hypothetical protein